MKPFAFAIAAVALTTGAHGAIVFSDSFENLAGTSTAVRPLSEGNWAGYIGNETTPASVPTHNSGNYRAGVVKNSNTTSSFTVTNYLFAQNQTAATAGTDYFLYTTANVTAFTPNDYTGLTASWNRNGNSAAFYSMALQVGGNWYVSTTDQGLTNVVSLNLLTTSWRLLTIDTTAGTGSLQLAGSALSYDDVFGAGQSVTGVGFFIDDLLADGTTRTIRIDEIVIDAVPEPSSFLLAAAAGMFPLLRRGRRRRPRI